MKAQILQFHEIKLTSTNGLVAGGKTVNVKTRNDYKKFDLTKMNVGEVIIIKRLK